MRVAKNPSIWGGHAPILFDHINRRRIKFGKNIDRDRANGHHRKQQKAYKQDHKW